MRNAGLFAIVFMLVFLPVGQGIGAEASTGKANSAVSVAEEETTDRIIVKLKASTDSLKGDAVGRAKDAKKLLAVKVPKNKKTKVYIKELEQRSDIEYAEPDYLVKPQYTPTDFSFTRQWHHTAIKTELAWDRSKGSNEIIVAVIDDGIDLEHPDLKERIVQPYDAVQQSFDSITVGEHGTHVAGIIASSIDNGIGGVGVAPHVNIMPINVFSGEGAYTSTIINAVYHAVDSGARIINLSLGNYHYSQFFNDAIQYAVNNGVLVVAAAGNQATSATHYPSSYANVISVSSTDRYDNPSTFTNFGSDIDVAAPGTSIYSTFPQNSYGYMSGTSMAAPVVAGLAALIWSNEPGLTNSQVADRLQNTSDDLGPSGKDEFYGYGRVNAQKALNIFSKPIVNEVSDQTTELTGSIVEDIGEGILLIKKQEETIASANVSSYTNFTVTIPKQSAGTILKVTVSDLNGQESAPEVITVLDRTPPARPTVYEVSDLSANIAGKAEPNSSISVITGTGQYSGKTDVNGYFQVKIPLQQANSKIEVTARDAAGNVSPAAYTIIKDKIAPVVKGIADKVFYRGAVTITFNEGTATLNGAFAKSGVVVEKEGLYKFVVTDQVANQRILQFTIDKTPPKISAKTTVNTIKSGTFTNQNVVVSIIENHLQQKTVSKDGKVVVWPSTSNFSTDGVYTVTAQDKAGLSSKFTFTIDKTKPNIPIINTVTDTSFKIEGKAEAYSMVKLYIDGKYQKSVSATKSHTYSFGIKRQKAGTKVQVVINDRAGNTSNWRTVYVSDKTPPQVPSASKVTSKSKYVSGIAEKGSTVYLYKGNSYVGKAITNSKGQYKIKKPVLKKGASLTIYAKDKAGNTSKERIIKIQ